MKKLTVGELKEKLKDVSDELEIELWSDSGVEQCNFDDSLKVVIEDAFEHKYKLLNGEVFDDTGTNEVHYFVIYCNWRDEEEE